MTSKIVRIALVAAIAGAALSVAACSPKAPAGDEAAASSAAASDTASEATSEVASEAASS